MVCAGLCFAELLCLLLLDSLGYRSVLFYLVSLLCLVLADLLIAVCFAFVV